MNSKQRVHNSLQKKPVDCVPIFMWFHPETAARFAKLLEIPVEYLAAAMEDDVRQTWVNNNYAMEGIVHEINGQSHIDFWGIKWVKEGPFNQIAEFPLDSASSQQILEYKFPLEHIDDLMENMVGVAANNLIYLCVSRTWLV